MKTKMILACAGLAACAANAQVDRPALQRAGKGITLTPTAVQPILGVRMDNTLVLGEKVYYSLDGQRATARGAGSTVYDAMLFGPDTDGDGLEDPVCGDLCVGGVASSRWFFGTSFATQAYADDIEIDGVAAAANPAFDGYVQAVTFASCNSGDPLVAGDGDPGNEPLVLLMTMYDSVDLIADLDGISDGFDNDGDGINETPYSRTDADGDGLVDEFTGGVVTTWTSVDTDGDGVGDILAGNPDGYYILDGRVLSDTDGDGIGGDPGATDFGGFPTTDRDGNGNPEGTLEVFMTSGEGPDTDGDGVGDGPIFGSFVASTLAQSMLMGTSAMDNSGCGSGLGIGAGLSQGIFWGQGQNNCDPVNDQNGGGGGFSDGASDGGVVNNTWDPSIDVTDFTAVVPCPDPITASVLLTGRGGGAPPCADTNGDGLVTPADFNAWIIAFNTMSAACDQNGDGMCTPADFNAWIINFNSGLPCPTP